MKTEDTVSTCTICNARPAVHLSLLGTMWSGRICSECHDIYIRGFDVTFEHRKGKTRLLESGTEESK